MKDLERIADKGALFFLQQFKDIDENVKDTMRLIERKIDGDNPTKEEWRDNATVTTYANSLATTYATSLATAYANSLATTYATAFATAYAYATSLATAYANATAYAATYATADYIIELLGDDLKPMKDINAQVLNAIESERYFFNMNSWHSLCGTTHCRGGFELILHPDGPELEKYFGTWMAATIIHKKSTGETVNYFASEDEVMDDLRKAG